jgi:hypothetical protein
MLQQQPNKTLSKPELLWLLEGSCVPTNAWLANLQKQANELLA